jgi:hypothetical protein
MPNAFGLCITLAEVHFLAVPEGGVIGKRDIEATGKLRRFQYCSNCIDANSGEDLRPCKEAPEVAFSLQLSV